MILCRRTPLELNSILKRLRSKSRTGGLRLFPDQDVRQRAVEPPQRGIADARKSAEQAEIESLFAAVPAVVTPRCGRLQHGKQPLRCALAQVGAGKRIAGAAEEFDAAERSATQRVDHAAPTALDALDGVARVVVEAA